MALRVEGEVGPLAPAYHLSDTTGLWPPPTGVGSRPPQLTERGRRSPAQGALPPLRPHSRGGRAPHGPAFGLARLSAPLRPLGLGHPRVLSNRCRSQGFPGAVRGWATGTFGPLPVAGIPRSVFKIAQNGFFEVSGLMLKLLAMACVTHMLPKTYTKHTNTQMGPTIPILCYPTDIVRSRDPGPKHLKRRISSPEPPRRRRRPLNAPYSESLKDGDICNGQVYGVRLR